MHERSYLLITLIGWITAVISTTAFVTLWFITANRELAQARQSVESAVRQVQLHKETYPQVRDGPYERAAANCLETSRMIYRETVKDYESIRQKPMNWIPAMILCYRQVEDGSEP